MGTDRRRRTSRSSLPAFLCAFGVLGILAPLGAQPLAAPPPLDTNIYVQPPAVTGRVELNSQGPTYTKYSGALGYGSSYPRLYSSHAYATFDLAGLPAGVAILSVRMWYYQYESYPSTPYTQLVLIPDASAPAQQLYVDIGAGTVIDPYYYTGNGWVVRSFNAEGLAAVDSCRTLGDCIDLGIAGGSCPYGAAYGAGRYGTAQPQRIATSWQLMRP
jgi:hypothetical protein